VHRVGLARRLLDASGDATSARTGTPGAASEAGDVVICNTLGSTAGHVRVVSSAAASRGGTHNTTGNTTENALGTLGATASAAPSLGTSNRQALLWLLNFDWCCFLRTSFQFGYLVANTI